MIEKMKVVHIVTTASEKAALLDRLRELVANGETLLGGKNDENIQTDP